MIGWEWEATAGDSGGCGLSDDAGRAQQAAEAWLRANPRGAAELHAAKADFTTALTPSWARYGPVSRAWRGPGGLIIWSPTPISRPRAGG